MPLLWGFPYMQWVLLAFDAMPMPIKQVKSSSRPAFLGPFLRALGVFFLLLQCNAIEDGGRRNLYWVFFFSFFRITWPLRTRWWYWGIGGKKRERERREAGNTDEVRCERDMQWIQ